jgi:hypothetical protein
MAHGSAHRVAGDMGVTANERGRKTTYLMKRLNISTVILGTWSRRICKNLENLRYI